MTIASYNDLVTAAQNWLFGRADIQPRVPEFIALFEGKANTKLFCRQMETRVSTPLNPTAPEPEFLALPGDYQTMTRVRLINTFAQGPVPTTKPRLVYATQTQMDELREDFANAVPGEPHWFSIVGGELEVLPTPDQAYSIEMVYRALLPPLGAVNATNWLLQIRPDAYLYGTLMEAAPYLHEDERIEVWAQGVQGAINDLNALSEKAIRGAGPLEMRRTRRSYG